MSVQAFRDAAVIRFREETKQHVAYLTERTEDTLEQTRLNQGIIKGLGLALEIVQQLYREDF